MNHFKSTDWNCLASTPKAKFVIFTNTLTKSQHCMKQVVSVKIVCRLIFDPESRNCSFICYTVFHKLFHKVVMRKLTVFTDFVSICFKSVDILVKLYLQFPSFLMFNMTSYAHSGDWYNDSAVKEFKIWMFIARDGIVCSTLSHLFHCF